MGRGGQNSAEAAAEPDPLRADARFAPFLADGFNAADFASAALADAHTSAAAQTAALQEGIARLNERICVQVTGRYGELVGQVGRLRDAEHAMAGITLAVEGLGAALARVRGEVAEPYAHVALRTRQLGNLHATVDLLRHVIHRLKLTAKLRQQLGTDSGSGAALGSGASASALDLAKAAKLLADIEAVGEEADLDGVDCVAADAEFLAAADQQVRAQAEAALRQGLEALSQAEVGSALQVYFNLGQLRQAVDGVVEGYASQLERGLAAALDARKLSPATTAGRTAAAPGGSAKWQEVVWDKLGAACGQVAGGVTAVWHLQRVLAKKRDPLTHVCFLDVVDAPDTPLPCQRIWAAVTRALGEALGAAASPQRGGFVREALTAGFPRLALLLEDTAARIQQDTQVKGTAPAVTLEQVEELLAAAAPFQNAYLAATLQRCSDAVTAAFAGGNRSLPTAAELQKCIARLHEEVKAVGDSARLARLVAGAVGTAVRLGAEKAEYMAATGPDLRALAGAANAAQQRNIALASQLQELHRSLAALLPRLPPPAAAALQAPLDAVQACAVEAVMPIFRAMVEGAEVIMLRMHEQDYGRDSPPDAAHSVTDASPYVADLACHIAHCRVEFLSRFSPAPSAAVPSFAGALVERMACRLLLFFTRHASLLRPLSPAGKLQLARDIAEVEVAVGQNLAPLEALGPPARGLRALRPLLFTETGALAAGSPLLAELPVSTVLHHLFSRAPPALASPHAANGLTPAQYSLWLDEHSMAEVVRNIRLALAEGAPAVQDDPPTAQLVQLMLHLCDASTPASS